MNERTLLVCIVLLALVSFGIAWVRPLAPRAPTALLPYATAQYQCDRGKTIDVSFYQGTSTPTKEGKPPAPDGKALVTLSDGQSFTLAQTISADGSRYSNGDPQVAGSESFVFWSKGNGAIVEENGVQKEFSGCIIVADDPGGLPQVYESGVKGFSIRYPDGFSVDQTYSYQGGGPGAGIPGVKFTIPASLAAGTNLSPDTYISVEWLPSARDCSAPLFFDTQLHLAAATTTEHGVDYSFASSTGAAAGNRYEEDVYALPSVHTCFGVRYFIHWGVIENYPPGAVQQFDERALKSELDAILQTLKLGA